MKTGFLQTKKKTVMMIEDWEVHYISFIKPNNAFKSPVVILGGIFQTLASFEYEIEQLSKEFPVYFIEFPGQGANDQEASEFDFEDYAQLLKDWMDQLGLEKIIPIALSYSSTIGYHFASMYPKRTQKLIIGGITSSIRASVRSSLEESLDALIEGSWRKFVKGAEAQLIVNKDELDLGKLDQLRYIQHTQRLLSLKGLPKGPSCETLVLTGEFDYLTTPDECFRVAKMCGQSYFTVIKGISCFGSSEKRDVITRLYRRFLSGRPLNRMKDVELWNCLRTF